MSKSIKILFSGGGSGGPVAPLLAVVDVLREDENFQGDFLWLGTESGPELNMVEGADIEFRNIASGKLRRYFAWKNFTDLFSITNGFFQSIKIIKKWKPDLVMSAGAFVSVPVAWAAWIMRVPVIIHQQDARAGLANKLMAPFAKVITVTFEKSLSDYGGKARWIGNPIRQDFSKFKISRKEAAQKFGLRTEKPVVVIMGGGTGAVAINKLVLESMDELAKFCQVIHITGKGKASQTNDDMTESSANYKYFEFLDKFGMIKIYAVASVLVSRCGMSSLTELSQLGIISILIPMPDSHQEDNAVIFKEAKAAVVLDQKTLNKEKFIKNIKKALSEQDFRDSLSMNIKKVMRLDASKAMKNIVLEIINKI